MHSLFKYSVTSPLLVLLFYDFLEVDAPTAPMQADVSHIPGVPWAPIAPGVPGSPGRPGSPWAPSRPFLVIPGTPGGPKQEGDKDYMNYFLPFFFFLNIGVYICVTFRVLEIIWVSVHQACYGLLGTRCWVNLAWIWSMCLGFFRVPLDLLELPRCSWRRMFSIAPLLLRASVLTFADHCGTGFCLGTASVSV